jgi:DNA-binding CsgD family transcriptional regulator
LDINAAPEAIWLRKSPRQPDAHLSRYYHGDLRYLPCGRPNCFCALTRNYAAEAIQAAFGLSSAEARLASALVAGHSLGDYAAQAGVSRNTVRNQLAAVFDKMGMRRRTELVATIVDALGPVGTRSDDKARLNAKASAGSP